MKKKIWFYLFIIQTIIMIGILTAIWVSLSVSKVETANLVEYVSQFSENNNFLPNAGYIPDAETAKIVGSQIIDKLTGNRFFGNVTIQYDKENRLWRVEKGYLFGNGGFVVIEQDSGKVIRALLSK